MRPFVFALLAAFVAGLQSQPAQADFVLQPPVSVRTGLASWNDSILKHTAKFGVINPIEPSTGYTECAETKEISHAYLCASYRQSTMNDIFVRATYFSEKSTHILRRDDPVYKKLLKVMGGHDLKGADLVRFYQALNQACEASGHDPKVCPSESEFEIFHSFLIPLAQSQPDFVVIAYGLLSDTDYTSVVTHEIMHAQYFLQPAYNLVADTFWAETVSEADKAKVRDTLGGTYDSGNERLMCNEFQAYILMTHAERNMLSALVPKYRQRFFKKMKEAGVVPIQLE